VLAAWALAERGAPLWLRVPVGLPAILWAPGHLLVLALVPHAKGAGEERGLRGHERFALAVAASFASVALLGLTLDAAPWGVSPLVLLRGVAALGTSLVLVALWRVGPDADVPPVPAPSEPPAARGALVGVVLALVVFGAAAGFFALRADTGQRYSELYALGENGLMADYPSQLAPGENATVIVGVGDHEGRALRYHVEARFERKDAQAPPLEAGARDVALDDGQRDEAPWAFQAPTQPGLYALTFRATAEGIAAREVSVTLRVA